tara:strand:- start:1148 stop:1297 length:150 start_codon:yes stop_codon:yes gene_type:complete
MDKDTLHTAGINFAAIGLSLADIHIVAMILFYITAAIYTSVKIYKLVKK